MTKRKAASVGVRSKKESVAGRLKRKRPEAGVRVPTDLSHAETDLVSHMEQGWRLETDSLGGNLVLRDLKTDEVIRPLSANRNTVEALQKRGLIAPGKGGEPLKVAWRLKKEEK